MWILGLVFVGIVVLVIVNEIHILDLEEREFPAMYSPDGSGKWVATEPFWIKSTADGQWIPNPIYVADDGNLNDLGVELKKKMQAADPWFGSNKRPKD